MSVPTQAIAGCRQSHRTLLATVKGLTDADRRMRTASRLPGWTVGHVLTHIARNADSVVRRLEGAARGRIVDQYVGGPAGRAAEIEAGAGRPAGAIIGDIVASAAAVERAYEAMPAEAWDNLTRSVNGEELAAWTVVRSRWREIEIHHVDLGLGYSPLDWPAGLIDECLGSELDTLRRRSDPRLLFAWVTGRGPAPALGEWR